MRNLSLLEKIDLALFEAQNDQQRHPTREGALIITKLQEALFWCREGGHPPLPSEREVEND